MKTMLTFAALAALLAGCANNNTKPTDTGSMAFPTPPPGSSTTRPAVNSGVESDTGSMAQPAPVPGSGYTRPGIPTAHPTDTGSMAQPRGTGGRPNATPE